MSVALVLIIIASILGRTPTNEHVAIARALVAACHEDRDCILDGVVYAEHESLFQLSPHAYSWDAKLGLARGPWQLHNAPIRVEDQARKWVALREASLKACGSLALLASGSCNRGLVLVRARQDEVATWNAILEHPWTW
jgi:hypothetical protein